jgi:hypothetical protein
MPLGHYAITPFYHYGFKTTHPQPLPTGRQAAGRRQAGLREIISCMSVLNPLELLQEQTPPFSFPPRGENTLRLEEICLNGQDVICTALFLYARDKSGLAVMRLCR